MARITRRYIIMHNPALMGPLRIVRDVVPVATPAVPLGLGDVVERAAGPAARLIDLLTARLPELLRTRWSGCRACSARRALLNTWLPDVRSAVEWWDAACRLWRMLRRP